MSRPALRPRRHPRPLRRTPRRSGRSPRKLGRGPARRPGFGHVLRVRDVAVLYAAEMQSVAGDQLARVAISVLVFSRTGSPGLAALTYAVTFLPAILGGVALSRMADRHARRDVMVVADLSRALLVALLAVPGMPTAVLIALVAVVAFAGPAFVSAEVGHLASVLDTEQFRLTAGLRMSTGQLFQVIGFGLGGAAVVAFTLRGALLIDAATYAVSALLIGVGLRRALPTPARRPRPSPHPRPEAPRRAWTELWRVPSLRRATTLSVYAGFFVVPEGLAVPFAHQIGATTAQVGFLLAVIPLGSAVGALALTRLVPAAARPRIAAWMAFGCGLALLVPALLARFDVALVSWFVSGLLAAYQLETMTTIARGVSERTRSASIGLAGALLAGAQGAGLACFGLLAQFTGAGWAIGTAGLVGSTAAAVSAMAVLRVRNQPRPRGERTDFDSRQATSEAVTRG